MNWTKIKENYPKAHKLLFDKQRIVMDVDSDRFLYDFFDEQGIVIDIAFTPAKESDGKTEFYYDFCLDDFPAFESRNHFKTRTEAEIVAFEKAFEILEDKL